VDQQTHQCSLVEVVVDLLLMVVAVVVHQQILVEVLVLVLVMVLLVEDLLEMVLMLLKAPVVVAVDQVTLILGIKVDQVLLLSDMNLLREQLRVPRQLVA
tara:strand:+ start:275 stop:574 length:300 start_codon:yes stop_codon:yes gene_type:complete